MLQGDLGVSAERAQQILAVVVVMGSFSVIQALGFWFNSLLLFLVLKKQSLTSSKALVSQLAGSTDLLAWQMQSPLASSALASPSVATAGLPA